MHKSGKVCQCQAMGGIATEYYINACERANMKFVNTKQNYVKKEKSMHKRLLACQDPSPRANYPKCI
jgi:hypothetical protein